MEKIKEVQKELEKLKKLKSAQDIIEYLGTTVEAVWREWRKCKVSQIWKH